MTRLDDWQDRFFAYLEATRLLPFAWGSKDCCLFAAGAVDAMCGTTFVAEISANYTDEESAYAYLATFDSLEAAATQWAGAPSLAPNFAGPGDVVLLIGGNGPTIGVCLGTGCAEAGDLSGSQYQSRDSILCCWKI
jgi:hypothetical protein